MSKTVQLNLKSEKISPYRTVAANTRVPGQLPAPLDSATFRIGQLSTGYSGGIGQWQERNRTVCPAGREQGWAGWLGPCRGTGLAFTAGVTGTGNGCGRDADQGAGNSGGVVLSGAGALAELMIRHISVEASATLSTTEPRTGWERSPGSWTVFRTRASFKSLRVVPYALYTSSGRAG